MIQNFKFNTKIVYLNFLNIILGKKIAKIYESTNGKSILPLFNYSVIHSCFSFINVFVFFSFILFASSILNYIKLKAREYVFFINFQKNVWIKIVLRKNFYRAGDDGGNFFSGNTIPMSPFSLVLFIYTFWFISVFHIIGLGFPFFLCTKKYVLLLWKIKSANHGKITIYKFI